MTSTMRKLVDYPVRFSGASFWALPRTTLRCHTVYMVSDCPGLVLTRAHSRAQRPNALADWVTSPLWWALVHEPSGTILAYFRHVDDGRRAMLWCATGTKIPWGNTEPHLVCTPDDAFYVQTMLTSHFGGVLMSPLGGG